MSDYLLLRRLTSMRASRHFRNAPTTWPRLVFRSIFSVNETKPHLFARIVSRPLSICETERAYLENAKTTTVSISPATTTAIIRSSAGRETFVPDWFSSTYNSQFPIPFCSQKILSALTCASRPLPCRYARIACGASFFIWFHKIRPLKRKSPRSTRAFLDSCYLLRRRGD